MRTHARQWGANLGATSQMWHKWAVVTRSLEDVYFEEKGNMKRVRRASMETDELMKT